MNDPETIEVDNATTCSICQSPADKLKVGIFVCQDNSNHMADGVVGLWSDLSLPQYEESNEPA